VRAPEPERLARVALSRLGEPGDPRLAGLVTELGAVRVRDLLLAQDALEGVGVDVAARLASLDPEAELERAERRGLRFVVPGDAEWPVGLDGLATAGTVQGRGGVPLGLWVRSRARLDELGDGVAVVGSRSSTGYGEQAARELSATAARAGFCVVSGAAFGIDQAAHRGALAVRAPTLAVLACGVDRAYPAAHRQLLDHIAEVGAVVSDSAPGCSPMRMRFLARNRIIAALGRGTVVVEAALRSGALSTATWTERLNRPLMGVPGPVTAAESQGVHERIRSGAAVLVTGGHDVLELLGAAGEHLVEVPRASPRPRDGLTARHRQVLDAVPVTRPAGTDSIARTAGIGVREVYRALMTLEERGMVQRRPAGWMLGGDARA